MHRLFLLCLGLGLFSSVGCMDNWHVRQSQLRTQQIYGQAKSLAQERDGLATQTAQYRQTSDQLKAQLNVANERINNLQSANSKMEQRLAGFYDNLGNQSPLSAEATKRFQELASRFPELDFDPQTGVSRFPSDLLFSSGSDELKPNAQKVLGEFAALMNRPEASQFNILIAGHTDNRPIAKQSTRSKHPTNWHLSTNRANSVLLALKKRGLAESRMGASGYADQKPIASNATETGRSRNRRVEIFVLAADAVVAEWWTPELRRQ